MMLQVTNLTFFRNDRCIINNLSFTLDIGKALLLQGANGSGKTTLLKLIANILEPQTGTINLNENTTLYLSHLNYLHPNLSVIDNVKYIADIVGASHSAVISALSSMQLNTKSKHMVHELSAGTKQKIQLTALLLSRAKLLLLDEPMSHLDCDNQIWLLNFLHAHIRNNGSAILSNHKEMNLHELQHQSLNI